MINKLERWAWWGGAMLAGIAGIVNAVGLQSYAHQAVTHLTGTTTLFSLSAARGDMRSLANLGIVLLAFAGGAAVSGFVVQNATLQLGRRYGIALLLESFLLVLAAMLMRSNNALGSYCASAACGLQNAMASTYSGAVLRTTHVSGMFTDIGAAFGHLLRGSKVDWIRVKLSALLVGAFVVGGIAGCILFDAFAANALYVPATLVGTVAAIYTVYAHHRERIRTAKQTQDGGARN